MLKRIKDYQKQVCRLTTLNQIKQQFFFVTLLTTYFHWALVVKRDSCTEKQALEMLELVPVNDMS